MRDGGNGWTALGAYRVLRPLLFSMPPSWTHGLALQTLRNAARYSVAGGRLPPEKGRLVQSTPVGAIGCPIGLAAGWDKDAWSVSALHLLRFGHAEIGTVTPEPQKGNPGKVLQRVTPHSALVNRLGFPSRGAAFVEDRLDRLKATVPIGVNVGPNRDRLEPGPVAEAAARLAPHARWVTLNLSSPNTKGLRDLLRPEGTAAWVTQLLEALDDANAQRPVLLKVHPDLDTDQSVALVRAALDAGATGAVAVNTTTDRVPGAPEWGGLSGKPLHPKALDHVRALAALDPPLLVGVGGVGTVDEAWALHTAGAHLLQVFTGLVYRGPGLAKHLHEGLAHRLDEAGLDRLEEAIGTDAGDISATTTPAPPR